MKPWRPASYRKDLPARCFLAPKERKYPICGKNKKPTCQGLIAAYGRAATVAGRARKSGTKGGALARRVKKKAAALRKKHGCLHRSDKYH